MHLSLQLTMCSHVDAEDTCPKFAKYCAHWVCWCLLHPFFALATGKVMPVMGTDRVFAISSNRDRDLPQFKKIRLARHGQIAHQRWLRRCHPTQNPDTITPLSPAMLIHTVWNEKLPCYGHTTTTNWQPKKKTKIQNHYHHNQYSTNHSHHNIHKPVWHKPISHNSLSPQSISKHCRYLTHQSPETVISQLPITTNDTQFTHKCDCNCCIIAAQCCNCARNPILALPSRMKVTYGDAQHVDVQRCSHLQWLLRKCCAKTTLEVCRASIWLRFASQRMPAAGWCLNAPV